MRVVALGEAPARDPDHTRHRADNGGSIAPMASLRAGNLVGQPGQGKHARKTKQETRLDRHSWFTSIREPLPRVWETQLHVNTMEIPINALPNKSSLTFKLRSSAL